MKLVSKVSLKNLVGPGATVGWRQRAVFMLALLALAGARAQETNSASVSSPAPPGEGISREMNLEQCLTMAMAQNHRRPASKFAVEMAEAQHRQALAGYWPQVTAKGGYQRMDESPDFLYPASTMHVPAGTSVVTVPAGVLGQNAVQVPVSTPAQTIQFPAQDIKLMDPDNLTARLEASWLLYDGGMRRGYGEQTRALVDMMKQESRRTDLEIMDSVRRYYYGAVLASQLFQVGSDTLARMETTLSLTETMYKQGSEKVKKTDWLDNKVMVESLRSMVALLEKNQAMSQAALANTMGLAWNSSIKPADKEVPFSPFGDKLDNLVSSAYQFNPDWSKIEAGIRAADGAVRTARSGYYPKLALTGELHKWWNDYTGGVATDRNKEGWTAGVGVEIPIFNGFLTRNKVTEARAAAAKVREEQLLFKEGIGLQIKDTFLGLIAAEKSFHATQEAMNAASENRDLNTRAYQSELVETEKVIRAQLMEAFMSAQHYKVRFDHAAFVSQLNFLVGTELIKHLQAAPQI